MAQVEAVASQPGAEARQAPLPEGGGGTLWHQFTQQQLKAWQPNLPREWVIAIYFAGGLLFAALGVWLLSISMGVTELMTEYTDLAKDNGRSFFTLEVDADMKPPIWIYYQLNGFHQNHRRYVKSRDDQQLRDDTHPRLDDKGSCAGKDYYKLCQPWVTDGDRVNYPCGLVARSVFNDSFAFLWKEKGAEDDKYEQLDVDSRAKTIAWAADVEGYQRFRNLDPEGQTLGANKTEEENQKLLNMWILRYFPPQVCQQVDFRNGYQPISVKMKSLEGGIQVPDCKGYMTAPSCEFEKPCGAEYKKVTVGDWGVQSGHFLVWMRIAGLPTFRKLWGKIDRELPKGAVIKVFFQDNFPVKSFGGGKAIVISTSSALGGRNNFLGYGYIGVGICCVIAGIFNLCWHSKGPEGVSTSAGGHPLLES